MRTKKPSISDVLFTKTQQQVLSLLYGQPNRGFYTNEIIRLTHGGTGAIQRELKKLAMVGLISVSNIGNQKHYQVNPSAPFFSELRSIVLKTFGLADVIHQALKSFESQIDIAFIYGSIAKQEDTAKSDIDLILISDSLTYAELFSSLEKAESQLGRPINPTIYSIAEWVGKCKAKNHFLIQLMKQPKIFVIGTEDELRKFK